MTFGLLCGLLASGCSGRPESEVVIYATLDRELVAPILGSFHRHADGEVQPIGKFGGEPSKAAELVEQLVRERDRPVADVLWNQEILSTIRLQRLGLLQPHPWRIEPGYPATLRASDGTWAGFAARARVLLINTDRLRDPADRPSTVAELADPVWKGRCAIARPLIGTSATHAAVLWYQLGAPAARDWFATIAANAVALGSERAVALAVANGEVDWGITDTDAAIIPRDQSRPVVLVYPDQASDQAGTLRIPNTVAVMARAPHPIAAAKLANFLVTGAIEDRLAMSDSSQLPISRAATHRPRALPDTPVRWMEVDFEAVADHWDPMLKELTSLFPQ